MHRDIKPSNIMMNEEGLPLITDFGISRDLKENKMVTMTGVIMGTPSYMSPEQVEGVKVDLRSDIYSLGAVLYELLTLQRPFDDASFLEVLRKKMTEVLPQSRVHIVFDG